MRKLLFLLCGLMVFLMAASGAALAQNDVSLSTSEASTDQKAAVLAPEQAQNVAADEGDNAPIFDASKYQSVLFTHWEHVAIQDARRYIGQTRGVTETELARDLKKRDDMAAKSKPPPEEREIRLSGIVYRGKTDWAIWLNEERVTPNAIPKEVMDLRVYKNYIEFKWFDDYTNQIFPIRLRPHQRFNIDTRIFLPG